MRIFSVSVSIRVADLPTSLVPPKKDNLINHSHPRYYSIVYGKFSTYCFLRKDLSSDSKFLIMSKGISIMMSLRMIILLILVGFTLASIIWLGYFMLFEGFTPF